MVAPAAAASESINWCSRHDSVRPGAGSSSVNILVQLCLCHHVSPTLMAPDTTVPLFRPLCQQPPQPEEAQTQPRSKWHTMQTADKNRMDTCHCGFALPLGHALKIKNKRFWERIQNGIPGPDWRNTCERLMLCLSIYWMWTRACIHLHTSGHLNGVRWSSAVTTLNPGRAPSPPPPHVSHCKLASSQWVWRPL